MFVETGEDCTQVLEVVKRSVNKENRKSDKQKNRMLRARSNHHRGKGKGYLTSSASLGLGEHPIWKRHDIVRSQIFVGLASSIVRIPFIEPKRG